MKKLIEKNNKISTEIKGAIFIFISVFLMFTMTYKLVLRRETAGHAMDWEDIAHLVPELITFSFIFSIVFYFYSKRNK
jgi:hypothetical protein